MKGYETSEQLLTDEFIERRRILKQVAKKPRNRLPKRIRKSDALVDEISNSAKYQPYVLESQAKSIKTAQKHIINFANKNDKNVKKPRSAANWIRSLLANYLVFLLLLVVWWYIATQI